MTLADAVDSFTNWSAPWTFWESIHGKLAPNSEQSTLFEALASEASRFEHWNTGDLVLACKIAHTATKRMFPNVADNVIASIVRAASYDWK